jgi:hypothetical protein
MDPSDVEAAAAAWDPTLWAWLMRGARAVDAPIPYRGALGLRRLDPTTSERVLSAAGLGGNR